MSVDQLSALTIPTMIATAVTTAIIFSIVGPFARKWRLGLIILAAGAFIEVLPLIIMASLLDGTFTQAVTYSIKIWSISFPLVLITGVLAWFARTFWDDLGEAFEVVLNRWGLRGAIMMIGVILGVFAAVMLTENGVRL